MWCVFAFASALFAGITSILAKCGIKKTNSYLATAIRTIVVLVFAWLMVGIVGAFPTVFQITPKTMIFLILSGFATGASWICYFKALQLGDINKVVPVDKSSTVLTMLMAAIFLGEPLSAIKIAGIAGIGLGTWMMIEKKKNSDDNGEKKQGVSWFVFAALSALFASLTSILGKVGISQVESNLGTAIRTIVVLIMAWVVAGITGRIKEIRKIDKRELAFICLSGIATGGSWLCYYRALQVGEASKVVPIDKLSVVFTLILAFVFLHEQFTVKSLVGCILIGIGTLLMVL